MTSKDIYYLESISIKFINDAIDKSSSLIWRIVSSARASSSTFARSVFVFYMYPSRLIFPLWLCRAEMRGLVYDGHISQCLTGCYEALHAQHHVAQVFVINIVCSFCIVLVHMYLFSKTIYLVYHGLIIVFPNFDSCHEYFTFFFQIPNNLFLLYFMFV